MKSIITDNNNAVVEQFKTTRQQFLHLCEPLMSDDYGLQAAPFTSPPKWHLAHSSWFFETFILKVFVPGYQVFHPAFEVLFNSYYNGVGEQFPRPDRGLLSRPTVAEVMEYRQCIDLAMLALLADENQPQRDLIIERCRLGIQHEKQHQELFFSDLKYSLSKNPLYPAYFAADPMTNSLADSPVSAAALEEQWQSFPGGLVDIGVNADEETFAFDNESPKHKVYLEDFCLATRLVTNVQYQAFIDDGGYQRPEFWLADGWTAVQQRRWQGPLYWLEKDGKAMEFTLYGLIPRQPQLPVCHISAYEADAYANWAGARLASEAEWEFAACQQPEPVRHCLSVHVQAIKPELSSSKPALYQLYDNCWQWTSSAYRPYPGYKAAKGAIGEYNGKFMCNQWVLRGGSCVSPDHHLRSSYRNFFYPEDRWQFSGIRLAK